MKHGLQLLHSSSKIVQQSSATPAAKPSALTCKAMKKQVKAPCIAAGVYVELC